MGIKVATTLSINRNVKKEFKKECVENGVDMSETTEQMWENYVEASKELKAERLEKSKKKNIS